MPTFFLNIKLKNFLYTIVYKTNFIVLWPEKSGKVGRDEIQHNLCKKERRQIMANKITWKDVLDDFIKHYPTLSKKRLDYRPYDVLTIIVYFPDNVKVLYNYTTKQASFLRQEE